MQRPRVFLSYSNEDRKAADDLAAFVRGLQVDVILDEEILLADDRIGETLRAEVLRCHGCLWLLTENSLASTWCPVEAGAFWGAGKPVFIFNTSGVRYQGPFSGHKQATSLTDVKRAIEGMELRGKMFDTVTVQEAEKIIETSVSKAVKELPDKVQELSDKVQEFREHLPAIRGTLEGQNTFLPNHAALLSKITEIVSRKPKRLMCAFDVPSFGSISAENEYREYCDVFDAYIATATEWDVTILLLPADVGIKIVNTEFPQLERKRRAWEEDLLALQRFQGCAQRAGQRGRRNFNIGWLAVNRDANGIPSGLHSMPLNVWVANDEEAVFSTVIDNYHPTGATQPNEGSQVKEIGFSTRNPHMVRFLNEIIEKYARNIDETVTLATQIAASEEVKEKIEQSMLSPSNSGGK